jgi:exo-beta-1,3-glucanase (GH17 family)
MGTAEHAGRRTKGLLTAGKRGEERACGIEHGVVIAEEGWWWSGHGRGHAINSVA